MGSRRVRRFVFAVLVLAGLGAVALTWDLQRRVAAIERAAYEVDARLNRMIDTTGDIAAAQQAYVGVGQQDDPWFARVASLLRQLEDDLSAAATAVRSPEARTALVGPITDAATSLGQFDSQVRENLRLGEELIAADRIFADGHAALDSLSAQLSDVREAERAALGGERDVLVGQTWTTLGATALLWLLGLALLVRLPARRQDTAPRVIETAAPAVEPTPVLAPGPPARPPLDLRSVADVCIAFSRMTAAGELPALLARAATILDASGLIIWIGAGEQLFAVTAHGYDPRVIDRLGPIGRNADNATAASWRSGEVKVVPGDLMSNGAVVAPMFSPDACIGVLAAEVRHGREDDAETCAVTSLMAAQLATVVSAWPAASAAAGETPPVTAATGS